MKVNLLILLSIISLASLNAFTQTTPTPDPKSKTDLELFQEKYGSVIVKGYTNLPEITGLGGTFKITVREFLDAATAKKIKGLQVEVDKVERYSTPARSFIEYGEIDSLIKGINYVAKIDKSVTTLTQFEAKYATKGEFSVTVFNNSSGKLEAAVTAGRIGSKSVFVSLETLTKIVAQLQEAKVMLDAL
jgi:hypothetical protein